MKISTFFENLLQLFRCENFLEGIVPKINFYSVIEKSLEKINGRSSEFYLLIRFSIKLKEFLGIDFFYCFLRATFSAMRFEKLLILCFNTYRIVKKYL